MDSYLLFRETNSVLDVPWIWPQQKKQKRLLLLCRSARKLAISTFADCTNDQLNPLSVYTLFRGPSAAYPLLSFDRVMANKELEKAETTQLLATLSSSSAASQRAIDAAKVEYAKSTSR